LKKTITLTVPVVNSGRVHQLAGYFEMQPTAQSTTTFDVDLPIDEGDWHIGLLVGPSGSGKSTIAREFFGESIVHPFRWPQDTSIVDSFPTGMGIKEITELLGSVGFSSPPSWLRPFRALSNGEQFRVVIAHALAQREPLTVIDEFSSVVDRQVAQICSAAVARTVRKRNQQLIAVSCHYDIIDWLQPDWVYDAGVHSFQWRELQRRPIITLTVRRVDKAAWRIFKHHHYMSSELSPSAMCFLATIGDRPVAFTAVLPFPHASRPGWREHRTVCLPDFQGVGIGNAMSAYVAGMFRATGKPYFSVTGNPSMIHSRNRSPLWRLTRQPGFTAKAGRSSSVAVNQHGAQNRLTAGFEFVGPANPHDALRFGIPVQGGTR
jgi:energy-coupling factor transporter ATP-binding protein EcfA2